jgi:hypothetical protein
MKFFAVFREMPLRGCVHVLLFFRCHGYHWLTQVNLWQRSLQHLFGILITATDYGKQRGHTRKTVHPNPAFLSFLFRNQLNRFPHVR